MKILIFVIFLSYCFTEEKGYIDSTQIRDPKIALRLSFIPGLGQIYNNKYLKAAGFVSAEYYAITKFKEFNSNGNNIGLRNTYGWWIFGVFIWNILDSYVDAHLSTFPIRKLESDMMSDYLNIGIN